MKAFINGLEVPFKNFGEPTVEFEGEYYDVVTDQTGEPYIQVGETTAYLEFRDDDGNIIPKSGDKPEVEDETVQAVKEYKELVEDNKLPQAKVQPKPATPAVKDPFMQSIESYLQRRGAEDELFAETLKKPAKNIKDCVNYIYSEVKKTGRQGFTDDEVYGFAVHYYDEDDLKAPANVTKPHTVVNTAMAAPAPVELSAEEKEKARKLAVDRAITKEADRLSAKKKAVAKAPVTDQPTLF